MYSFIDKCIRGEALLEDIDDYVDTWHDGDYEVDLKGFLGMSADEYQAWVLEPDSLALIIKARIENRNALDLINSEVYSMAARSQDHKQLEYLQKWLKSKGYTE